MGLGKYQSGVVKAKVFEMSYFFLRSGKKKVESGKRKKNENTKALFIPSKAALAAAADLLLLPCEFTQERRRRKVARGSAFFVWVFCFWSSSCSSS